MRFADRPLLLLIVAAVLAALVPALGLWIDELITENVAAQGQVNAGERIGAETPFYAGSTSTQATGENRQAGYNPASAAPKTYWGTHKTTAFVLYRSDGPLREFIVKFDLPDIPNREGWR